METITKNNKNKMLGREVEEEWGNHLLSFNIEWKEMGI